MTLPRSWLDGARRVARRRTILVACLAVLSTGAVPAGSSPLSGGELREVLEQWRRGAETEEGSNLEVLEPMLAARIEEIRATSPTFAKAWAELERSGVPVVIGTRGQLDGVLPGNVRSSRGWAGVTVSWDGSNGRLARSAVVIHLDWLRDLHRVHGNPRSAFLDAVDGLLIHEIYGHLAPAVEGGTARARCADPGPGESLAESCVGRRELALKGERAGMLAAR